MVLNDPLSNALSLILNSEKVGKTKCLAKPISKIMKEILKILKENNYITDFTEIADGKGNMIEITLSGNINKCGAIKPRYSIKLEEYEKFEKRYLPSRDIGILILTTPMGIMIHQIAKSKKTGGRLLAYCY